MIQFTDKQTYDVLLEQAQDGQLTFLEGDILVGVSPVSLEEPLRVILLRPAKKK